MKLNKTFLLAILCPLFFASVSAAELNEKKNSSENKKEVTEKIYMFGVGFSFNDSIVYVSSICELTGVPLQKKTKFLPYRSEFSLQLKQYLEGYLGNMHQTCTVFFSKDQKKLLKRYNKVKKHYLNSENKKLQILGVSEFSFKNPIPADEQVE